MSSIADSTFVTIFRDRHRKGFPQPPPAVEPDAGFRDSDYAPGPLDAPTRIVRSVRELVTATFTTDAHFSVYVNYEIPLRLNHNVWGHSTETFLHTDAYDVDCPKDLRDAEGRASEAWWQAEQVKVRKLLAAEPGVICFRSRGGYRLIGARSRPFKLDSEAASLAWTRDYVLRGAYLHKTYGILVDPACRDWTRLQRTALATREGRGVEPGIVLGDLEAFGAWRYPGMLLPMAEAALAALAETRPEWVSARNATVKDRPAPAQRAATPEGASWDLTGPAVKAAIDHIAKHFPASGRHALCQAIGGMLRDRGTTPEAAYFIVYEGARLGGSTDPRTRAKAASDTWRLGPEAAKTAYTTVCALIGQEAASQLGNLFTDAQHEALLRRTRKKLDKPVVRVESAAPAKAPPASPAKLVTISELRQVVQRVKRKKASSDEPKQLVQALLLQRLVDGEPLSEPAGEDAVTGLSSAQALDKLVSVLAWNLEPGTTWAAVKALVERTVLEMVSDEAPLALWLERAEEGYKRAVRGMEIQLDKRQQERGERSAAAKAYLRGGVK